MNSNVASLLLWILIFSFHSLLAQQPVEITGKVVERASQQPLEYATIQVLEAGTQQLITGTTTAPDGTFSLETEATNFSVAIGFIGFVTTTLTDFTIVDGRVAVGTIGLAEDAETLDEVLVRGEKSQTEFKLDKRVFNVGQDLSSTGASALEVLNNVPSVNVNIEGQVRLRGSAGVQILINGKPSVLASGDGNALGTITADMIEKVEVITNPSAKYNAEGTSGIINIVIKKEEKRGLNGSVTLNTGVPNNHSLGLSLNNRTEKFNLFSQLGVGYRTFPEQYRTTNRNLLNDTTVSSTGEGDKNEAFFNVILGTDYHINDRNVLSLTGHFAYEWETEYSNTDFRLLNADNALASRWTRNEVTEATNPKWQYELQYKKDFPDDEDHTLLVSALGSFFGKDQSSEYNNTPVSGEETFDDQQQTRTDFLQGEYTFQLDYTRPFTDQLTLETGAQYVITDVANDFAVSNWLDTRWVEDPELTNVFEYNQKVGGSVRHGSLRRGSVGRETGPPGREYRSAYPTHHDQSDKPTAIYEPVSHGPHVVQSDG